MQRRYTEYVLRRVGCANFLIDTSDKGASYREPLCLNDLGAEIFLKLDAGKSAEEIVQELAQQYEVDSEVIREDVTEFIGELRGFGIL